MTNREEYEAAVARNNALRRKLKSLLMRRNHVSRALMLYRFNALVERVRQQIEQHSNLIAELEARMVE